MIKRINHRHLCDKCNKKIVWAADVQLVDGELVYRHIACITTNETDPTPPTPGPGSRPTGDAMNIRYAFDYLSPTTLVAVINDQMNTAIGPDQREIVQAAHEALISNAGIDEALDMLTNIGIDYLDMEA